MLSCPAALPLSRKTLTYAAGVIRHHRKQIGSPWRKLTCGQQALLVLAYLRKGETFAELAAGFGIGTSTAWQYVTETVGLLAARSPKLRNTLARAKQAGYAYVVIDGTLIPIDRVSANRPFYSVELADASGLEAVSTRNIAARLGVAAASLYWHVPSKGDLHELMFDAIIREIDLPPAGTSWRDSLQAIARSTRALFQRHPWAILLGVQPGLGPNNQQYAQAALAALSDMAPDPALQVEALALLNNYLFGFAHRETAWQQARNNSGLDDAQWTARLRRYLDQAASQDPATARVLSARLHLASDQSFEFGLECLLDGIAARLTSTANHSGSHPG